MRRRDELYSWEIGSIANSIPSDEREITHRGVRTDKKIWQR